MHETAIASASFLLAVLWFDLMFDVQVRGSRGALLPQSVLSSISAYYRRVTTEARPMNRLVSLAMLVAFGSALIELLHARQHWQLVALSLACVSGVIGLALVRTFPNAVALGKGGDTPSARARLARAIYGDHLICFAAMVAFVALQVADQWAAKN